MRSSLQFSCEPLSVVDSPLQQQLPKHSKGEDCTSMKVNRNLFFTALTLTALTASVWAQTQTASNVAPLSAPAASAPAAPPITAADIQELKDALAAQQRQI